MKRFICVAGIAAGILAGGCASDHDHHQGGTYDHYDKNTGYDSSGTRSTDPNWKGSKDTPNNYGTDVDGTRSNNRVNDGTENTRP